MGASSIDILSWKGSLNQLYQNYINLEEQFWRIIYSKIKDFFPNDFDVSHLWLNSILADIKWNLDSNIKNPIALRRISKTKYNWKLSELYKHLEKLHWYKIDWFLIEVEWFNLDNNNDSLHLVNIHFIKEDTPIIEWVSELVEDISWRLLEKLS